MDIETRRYFQTGAISSLTLAVKSIASSTSATATKAVVNLCQYPRTQASSLPKSIDWRNITTPIADQGYCGCCYALTAAEMCDAYQRQVKKVNTILSVQNLISCDGNNQGCGGGYLDLASNYITSNGLATEAKYPFVSGLSGITGKCSRSLSKLTKTKCPKVNVEIYSYANRTGNCDRLKDLLQYGPVGINLFSSEEGFLQYKSGVYSSVVNVTGIDHSVLAVGYTTLNGTDAFIVQNSWGTGWGNQGFVHIAATGNQLNMCTELFYYNVKQKSCQ